MSVDLDLSSRGDAAYHFVIPDGRAELAARLTQPGALTMVLVTSSLVTRLLVRGAKRVEPSTAGAGRSGQNLGDATSKRGALAGRPVAPCLRYRQFPQAPLLDSTPSPG
jgi:hypothetical protein